MLQHFFIYFFTHTECCQTGLYYSLTSKLKLNMTLWLLVVFAFLFYFICMHASMHASYYVCVRESMGIYRERETFGERGEREEDRREEREGGKSQS